MALPQPFGPDSKTGFELELLAPRGKSRRDLAIALAKATGGEVRQGFKYQSEGPHRDGRPICDLTPAWRIEHDGDVLFTLVDDVTVRDGLDADADTPEGLFRLVLDDLRFALWAEPRCWAEDGAAPEVQLAPLLETFEARIGARGRDGAKVEHHRVVATRWDHALCVLAAYEGERERVCEVVTRPLGRDEREDVIARILDCALAAGFVPPAEAALHVHLDNAPWMSSERLCQLIADSAAARSMLYEILKPNPRCRRLAAFAPDMVRLARTRAALPFDELRKLLLDAGATKYVDINVLGVLKERPRHPTVEVRCLPMSLDVAEMFSNVAAVEDFLGELAVTADR